MAVLAAVALGAQPRTIRGAHIGRNSRDFPASRRLEFLGFTRSGKRLRSSSLGFCKRRGVVAAAASPAPETTDARYSQKLVLVVGATGGVGQLAVASLLEKGVEVRALLRNAEKARSLFGDKLQVVVGDTRNPEDFVPSMFEGVTHVLCCTGTTAFPSKRWAGDNTPEQTDWIGVRNLIAAVPKTIQRFVLVSSVGVTKCDQLPWNIMNLFGVLKYKKMGEDFLRSSGLPYTIIRPGRLTDGPYTSYDLNTLLKATSGTRRDVILGQGDTLVGEASRIMVAEACIQAMDLECTCGQTYELNSVQGDGPGSDCNKWAKLFVSAGTGTN
ncbi:protein TIC 62, chloroplastic [Selaginella moellendorffii]|uniref:protein TIC 62, chloroplastic n=1 Tax=Selaginella moellendorffii TaxID=88036 RepID=UPI000D1CD469|nr:protein TIC 62, chloroplastic [Selaginella moellendorffii]|eukprot:XP_024542859.1 protein TIC 62, chloroplastic [Selaginella moellendorffii]